MTEVPRSLNAVPTADSAHELPETDFVVSDFLETIAKTNESLEAYFAKTEAQVYSDVVELLENLLNCHDQEHITAELDLLSITIKEEERRLVGKLKKISRRILNALDAIQEQRSRGIYLRIEREVQG